MIHILELDPNDNDRIISIVRSDINVDNIVKFIMDRSPIERGRSETTIKSFIEKESLFYCYIDQTIYYCAIDVGNKRDRDIFSKYEKFIGINRETKLKMLGI
jgi:hypothetical protein